MAQTRIQSPPICQSCAFFDDYQEERGRGWCRAFDKPARRHHPRTSECELVSQDPPKTVRVELQSKAVEDDGCGYPVAVDSQLIEVTVNEFTPEALETALQPLFDLSEWVITHFWQPELQSEF